MKIRTGLRMLARQGSLAVLDLLIGRAGHDWITRRLYRPWRIARRLARMAMRPRGWRALPYAAAINLGYYGRTVRWRLRGWDPEVRCSRPLVQANSPST